MLSTQRRIHSTGTSLGRVRAPGAFQRGAEPLVSLGSAPSAREESLGIYLWTSRTRLPRALVVVVSLAAIDQR